MTLPAAPPPCAPLVSMTTEGATEDGMAEMELRLRGSEDADGEEAPEEGVHKSAADLMMATGLAVGAGGAGGYIVLLGAAAAAGEK